MGVQAGAYHPSPVMMPPQAKLNVADTSHCQASPWVTYMNLNMGKLPFGEEQTQLECEGECMEHMMHHSSNMNQMVSKNKNGITSMVNVLVNSVSGIIIITQMINSLISTAAPRELLRPPQQ